MFKKQSSSYNQWDIEKGLHRPELFRKMAEEVMLSEQQDQWQPEIASEAYKQAPYLSDYSVNVVLDKTDPDTNSAYGNIEIKNKFDAPSLNKDDRNVKVPVIVDNRHLKPFDILSSDGKFSPLSEDVIKQLLFRAEPTELSDRQPARDRYIGYMSSPPYGGSGTGGFSGGYDGGVGKYASILDKVKIEEEDKEKLYEKLSSNVSLERAFLNNPAFSRAVEKIASYHEIEESEDITCLRFEKLSPKEVLVKWASSRDFEPKEQRMSVYQAAKFASLDDKSSDEVFALEPGNSLTLTTNTVQKETMDQYEIKEITEFGEYNVQDIEDHDLVGWVLPIVTFENVAVPTYLFTNGSEWAFQDTIAGSRVGQGNNLPQNKPAGMGVFYSVDSGKALATIPVEVSHIEGTTIVCSDQLGQGYRLEVLDVPTMVKLDEGSYAIPSSMKFLRLPEKFTQLKSEGGTFNKVATIDWTTLTKHAEDWYSIRGYCTEVFPQEELSKEAAEFALDVMGFDGKEIVKKAEKQKVVKLAGGNRLEKKAQARKYINKQAQELRKEFDKINVVKLASVFTDDNTVDKVLSLGVLNSDNISKYQDYLPSFQEVEEKLAELLFAIRCGLSPVPEESAKLGLSHISKLIKGLKDLKEKKSLS